VLSSKDKMKESMERLGRIISVDRFEVLTLDPLPLLLAADRRQGFFFSRGNENLKGHTPILSGLL
jgi:hypothetical protein